MSAPIVHFSRRYRFSASHRLHSPALTAEQNRDTYGKCNNRFGHGHNYVLQVTVAGPIDPQTGFVISMPKLDALVQHRVIERFDETDLNADPVFAGAFVPSTENLVYELESVLRTAIGQLQPGVRLAGIRVEETANNSFDLPLSATPEKAEA